MTSGVSGGFSDGNGSLGRGYLDVKGVWEEVKRHVRNHPILDGEDNNLFLASYENKF